MSKTKKSTESLDELIDVVVLRDVFRAHKKGASMDGTINMVFEALTIGRRELKNPEAVFNKFLLLVIAECLGSIIDLSKNLVELLKRYNKFARAALLQIVEFEQRITRLEHLADGVEENKVQSFVAPRYFDEIKGNVGIEEK